MLNLRTMSSAFSDTRRLMVLGFGSLLICCGSVMTAPVNAQSNAAQQLFGISESAGNHGSSLPASCDISKLQAKNKTLEAQLTQINNDAQAQINKIHTEVSSLKPGDTAGNDALQAQEKEILATSNAKTKAIHAQQEAIHAQTQGPSEQCKRDTIAASIAEMRNVNAVVSGSAVTSSFNKIDTVVAKIESLEPTLQKNGVNSKDMETIKTSVTAVKSDTATLRSFMSAMSSKSAAFIAQASADPIGTYNATQSGNGPLSGVSGGTEKAMSNLVTSFTNLVTLFDKLSGGTGE